MRYFGLPSDLVQRYGVSGVPRTVVNETIDLMGAVPEASFLEAVLETQKAA